MAEKQCNLIKNGGGTDKVMLRETITNSGSQTLSSMLDQLYSTLTGLYTNDVDALSQSKIKIIRSNIFQVYTFSSIDMRSAHLGVSFMALSGDYVSNKSYQYFQSLFIRQSGSVKTIAMTSQGSTSIQIDVSDSTDVNTVELWY